MIRNVLFALLLLPAAALASEGAALFKQNCAVCHGKDGSGNTPTGKALKAQDLRRAEVQKLSDAAIAKLIRDGKRSMPAFKAKMSDADIAALVAHIRALAK